MGRKLLNTTLKPETIQKLREAKERTGISISRIIEKSFEQSEYYGSNESWAKNNMERGLE